MEERSNDEDAPRRQLRGADLPGADLSGQDLRHADLRGARLTRASLRGADLSDACLRGTDLSGADLSGATLDGADLTGARPDAATLWPAGFDLAAHRASWAAENPEPPGAGHPREGEDDDGPAFERRVLAAFFVDGRLQQIPTMRSPKKLLVVLRRLASEFEPERRYPEKQVNETLARFHPDFAMLRRNLVDYRLMARQHGLYWRLREVRPHFEAWRQAASRADESARYRLRSPPPRTGGVSLFP